MTQHNMGEHTAATVAEALRLGSGFAAHERVAIVAGWESLDERLRSFTAGTVDLEVWVKDRGRASQRTMLEARISGHAPILAISEQPDVAAALREIRDDMVRQLTDAKGRTEPRNNPARRVTIRHER